jgi:hypothetical protein
VSFRENSRIVGVLTISGIPAAAGKQWRSILLPASLLLLNSLFLKASLLLLASLLSDTIACFPTVAGALFLFY